MNKSFYLIIFVFLFSCGPSRNLVYFSDLQENTDQSTKILNSVDPKIQPDDLLGISVSTLNPESNALFNSGILLPPTVNNSNNTNTNLVKEGFLVDKNGFISYPVLGQIKLGGLSKEEATKKMIAELKRYIKGEPIVNIRYLNFKVTVIGEVNRPSTISVPTEKINVLEALGMAGDMTVYGKRENVLIIREKEGKRNITRVNLNTKETLNSPYFYLQQNDVVYVEPVVGKYRATQANTNRNLSTILVGATSLLTLIITRFF
ncbi:polysaccharide biosynthesis/export family protein [Adhaeribacter radiodurans]|uniref:Polysaccharide biosynthesis/export family protein n=1 Tax=Adhaeribacter radiodurans TaxID=2745197 RepID=A0A7L7L3K2_9BACT|nr:polysaccharide biosynthesis/export family protein [Adhaeribacter radiodurans]QMU27353.1 polysaccharide biosynthesis/export family protein [Adhaeribacter radiodurans]